MFHFEADFRKSKILNAELAKDSFLVARRVEMANIADWVGGIKPCVVGAIL